MGDAVLLVFFFVSGFFLIWIGWWLGGKTRRFLERGTRCTGRYVAVAAEDSMSDPGRYMQQAVVEFVTAEGKSVRFTARTGTLWEWRKIGRPVAVVYDPLEPQEALVDTFVEKWLPVIIPSLTGVCFVVAAVVSFFIKRG